MTHEESSEQLGKKTPFSPILPYSLLSPDSEAKLHHFQALVCPVVGSGFSLLISGCQSLGGIQWWQIALTVSQARNGVISGISCAASAGDGWRPFPPVTCSARGLGTDRGLQFSLLLTINLHKQSIPTKNSSKASMTGNIQSMKWMLIAWQSSAWKTWNVPYAWRGWALQRRGEIKVWLQYIFLFLRVCTEKRQWTFPMGKVHKYNCYYSKLFQEMIFYSVAPSHSFPWIIIHEITARAI